MPENPEKHCREWPADITESVIKFFIQENSKPQDLVLYTDGLVSKDQSSKVSSMKTVQPIRSQPPA